MLRTVDKVNGIPIQQVISPKGETLRYQAGEPGDASKIQVYKSLTAARAALGAAPAKVDNPTPPKSAHKHNQPGYRADKAK